MSEQATCLSDRHMWRGPLRKRTRCVCGVKVFGATWMYTSRRREARSWPGVLYRLQRIIWGGNGRTHWENGCESGFPVCCVLWFCAVWECAFFFREVFPYGVMQAWLERYRRWGRVEGRVACPACRLHASRVA